MRSLALALADALLARDATQDELVAGAQYVLGAPLPWVPSLCRTILDAHGDHLHWCSRKELAGFILEDATFCQAFEQEGPTPEVVRFCLDLPRTPPAPAWLAALALPSIPSGGDLARWFDLPVGAVGWFGDQWRVAPERPLQHYHTRWVDKRSGGLRLIEIPKRRLHALQRRILRGILDLVPAHPAAHGFRRGHSCLTHAALHAGRRVVLRMDLKNFFTSVPASRVQALFATLGYRGEVGATLARICTTRTPTSAFAGTGLPWVERQALRAPHLPQGSPCSPALANLCAFRLDVRLTALAISLDATYSRYADDLVFSGGPELERAMDRVHARVGAIVLEEGFELNTRKTRMMREGVRQQVTGIVVNAHPNVPRAEFDLLKATLTNCLRHGPASQNREGRPQFRAWLAGKVSYVGMVNPARGQKLRRLLDAIAWAD